MRRAGWRCWCAPSCQALALHTDLGVPEADDIHAYLTALDQATGDYNEE